MEKKEIGLVNLNSPFEVKEFSTRLRRFIVAQKLYTEIKGKAYVNVEGWQFAGLSTGVVPIVREVFDLSSASEKKFRAEVELYNLSLHKIVGYGVAICSSKEAGRSTNDEYVIASMAQTRAIGKAYRNIYAWLIKMAKFEATPAEEMLEVKASQEKKDEIINKAKNGS